jgi:uncharacterized protein DUF3226
MKRKNPSMPASDFGLLLVEGGDEDSICRILAGPAWGNLCCWKADGRDLPSQARLAKNDPNFRYARSVGVVLDIENDLAIARVLARETLAVLGATAPFVHGDLTGSPPRLGAFLTPDGTNPGAIETICRTAVRDRRLSACVDQLVSCAGIPHATHGNPRAAEDKGWLKAYLGMTPEPDLRFYQAFDHPQGIDAAHPAFAPLRDFILAL